MAYLPSQNTILLQIAKTGSTSLIKAASTVCDVTHIGHLSASAHNLPGARVIAVTRDPLDRLVSAVNYYYSAGDVDDVCRHIERYRRHQAAFRPQTWYMDVPGVEIFSVEDALSEIGYRGDVPHENASNKWLTKERACESKVFRRLMSWYDEDYSGL